MEMEIILEHWIINSIRKNLIKSMKNYPSFRKIIIAGKLIILLEAVRKKINLKITRIIRFWKGQDLKKSKVKLWVRRC